MRRKIPRNTHNETQQREQRTGYFLRRHDDAAVVTSCSRPQMFGEANREAKRRSALARLCRQVRNSPARLLEARRYNPAAAIAHTPAPRSVELLPYPSHRPAAIALPGRSTRQEIQLQRDRAAHRARLAKVAGSRRGKGRPFELPKLLAQMDFAGGRPLQCPRDAYEYFAA